MFFQGHFSVELTIAEVTELHHDVTVEVVDGVVENEVFFYSLFTRGHEAATGRRMLDERNGGNVIKDCVFLPFIICWRV